MTERELNYAASVWFILGCAGVVAVVQSLRVIPIDWRILGLGAAALTFWMLGLLTRLGIFPS